MITEDQLGPQWFQDMGWSYANGTDLAPEGVDFRVVLKARMAAVQRLNPQLPPSAVEGVVHVVTTPLETSLAWKNRAFHRLPLDGMKVEFTNAQGGELGVAGLESRLEAVL